MADKFNDNTTWLEYVTAGTVRTVVKGAVKVAQVAGPVGPRLVEAVRALKNGTDRTGSGVTAALGKFLRNRLAEKGRIHPRWTWTARHHKPGDTQPDPAMIEHFMAKQEEEHGAPQTPAHVAQDRHVAVQKAKQHARQKAFHGNREAAAQAYHARRQARVTSGRHAQPKPVAARGTGRSRSVHAAGVRPPAAAAKTRPLNQGVQSGTAALTEDQKADQALHNETGGYFD